ncbi:MAG: DUF5916 domain-containing protein [Acidobacteria bacterium]|nr:DUF5916 domain-containing protein [Acidobacteriota bacterium]
MTRLTSIGAAVLLLLSAGPAPATAQEAGGTDNGAVAILPFANISGTATDDWFGAGIAESLAASLQGAGVAIVHGESPAAATDAETGRALGATWVIGGSYQRQGERLRITARIVETAGGTVVRTSILDGATAELFALQDRLAADLRPALPDVRGGAPLVAAREPGSAEPPPPARPAAPGVAIEPTAPRRAPAPEAPPAATAAVRTGGGSAMAPRVLIDGPPPPVAPATVTRDVAGRVTMRATRLPRPLQLDGVLDEGFYEVVPPVDGFLQQMPLEGAPATERTEAWVFFDDENLYISARIWDSAPESRWVANEMLRDSFQLVQNEYFGIALDTFYDRRNGLNFMINPLGGFGDYQITDESNPNIDWNPIWDSATGRFDGGWTLETQIPFKSLRFRPGQDAQVWGMQLTRNIRWKNEVAHMTPVPISGGPGDFRLSAAGTLTGVEVPRGNRTFEIKPYAIGGLATDVNAVPAIVNDGTGDAGIDVKFGLTENLTADFTYNTDFAQVEVDQQQVNLTRFSLFFPEKRDFFLESRGIFDFGVGANFGGGGGFSASRPTGGATAGGGFFGGGDAPVLFFSRRIGLQANEEGLTRTVPILGGGRLTGRIGPFSIGALTIQTDGQQDVGALATNFSVFRVSRDILRRSRIGAIITRRSLSTRVPGSANEVFGVDGQFAFYDNLYMNGYYSRSRTLGLEGDDDSYQGVVTYNGDLYAFQVDHLHVGDNFNPEIGFMRRWNFRRTFATGQFAPRPRGIEAVRQFVFGASLDYVETGSGAVETRIAQARFETELENSDRLAFDVQRSYELLARDFPLAPDVTIPIGGYDFQDFYAAYQMGPQRRLAGTFSVQHGGFFNGTITAVGFQRGRLELTPQFSLEPGISINRIELPMIGEATIPLVTSRVTYTLTPRMFFGGLIQYNSSNSSLGTNLRLRWEYQPGSELFVVYNDTRDTSIRGRAPFLENRAFIVKLTRLFRF